MGDPIKHRDSSEQQSLELLSQHRNMNQQREIICSFADQCPKLTWTRPGLAELLVDELHLLQTALNLPDAARRAQEGGVRPMGGGVRLGFPPQHTHLNPKSN